MRWGVAASAAVGLLASSALGRGASPYLSLTLDPELERAVERVLVLAGEPVLVRPVPLATLVDALPRACRVDAALCRRVRGHLDELEARVALMHAELGLSGERGADWPVPNSYGLSTGAVWQGSALLVLRPLDHALLSLGFEGHEGGATPTGSLLSLGGGSLQLDVGWRPLWLSPATDAALLLSSNAPTMPSVTLSNYRPLTRFGVRYLLFLARMSESDEIEHRGARVTGNPRLAGVHLSLSPTPGWALGVSRVLQYGGGPRDASLGKLIRAFIDPEAYDNTSAGLPFEDQFGNQLASISTRLVFPGAVPFALYAEYAGEDTSRRKNYLLGNSALALGIDFPRLGDRFDLSYEFTEWQNGWYTNSVYGDGLMGDGRVLGHWGADARVRGDEVGAQSHSLRLGIALALGSSLELRYRTLANEPYSPHEYVRSHAASLRYSRSWRGSRVAAELHAGRDTRGAGFARVALSVEHPGDATESPPAVERSRADAPRSSTTEVFVDLGTSAARSWIDLDSDLPETTTSFEASPHLAIGARRAVSRRQDLGMRLELDVIDGSTLLGARALDYRVRLGRHAALCAFLGAARYDLATPAYGLYGGVGAQWRDLRPRWDLGVDAKYALDVARDHLRASDPVGGRPDSFYDLLVVSAYLSRRF
jgi:hypothetical protein